MLWTALAIWAGGILWLSSLSPDELPDAAFAFWDKLNHVAAFAVGGWLAAAALRTSYRRVSRRRVAALAVLLIAAFGLLDEALQTITPGRTGADVLDWMADVLGALGGVWLYLRTHRLSFGTDPKERR